MSFVNELGLLNGVTKDISSQGKSRHLMNILVANIIQNLDHSGIGVEPVSQEEPFCSIASEGFVNHQSYYSSVFIFQSFNVCDFDMSLLFNQLSHEVISCGQKN